MAMGNQSSNGAIIADINITPLTDVMLVLLIIFMVTATFFVAEPAMEVALPPAVSSELVAKEDGDITVVVTAEGRLFVNGDPTPAEHLTQALLQAARESQAEQKVIVVRGDTEATYGQIVWIMDSARLVGLRNVSLSTQRPEGEAGTG
jgi:biopolymer transport protein TolR